MLAHDLDGGCATFRCRVGFAAEEVDVHRVSQQSHQALRMMEVMGKAQGFLQARRRPIGITEHPERQRGGGIPTNAGVMTAETKRLGVMLLRVIGGYALVGVLDAHGELAEIYAGGPLGMVSLQQKRGIVLPCRQAGKLVRQLSRTRELADGPMVAPQTP